MVAAARPDPPSRPGAPKHLAIAALLEAELASGIWSGGKLPPVRALAIRYRTSPVTMLAALRRLKAEGKVATRPGRLGYFPPGAPPEPAPPPPAWERIARTLRSELLEGRHPPGIPFPLRKELRHRFHGSRDSVNKALGALVAEGLLEAGGKRVRLPERGPAARGAGRILVVVSGPLHDGSGFPLDSLKSFERECQAHGIGHPPLLVDRNIGDTPRAPGGPFAGVCYVNSAGPGQRRRWLEWRPRRPGPPMVVLDNQELEPADPGRKGAYFHLVPDNRRAGREVGAALSALGHRQVAFFSFVDTESPWLPLRIEGLERVFPRRGDGTRRLHIFDGQELPQVRGRPIRDRRIARAARILDGVYRGAAGAFDASTLGRERDQALAFTYSWYAATLMAPLFEAALADRAITAWVCVNDGVARFALDFLRKRRIPAPGRVSVVGFDNHPSGYESGLASYDLGLERMGTLAVHCCLRPHLIRPERKGVIHVAGQLIRRASLGRAPA